MDKQIRTHLPEVSPVEFGGVVYNSVPRGNFGDFGDRGFGSYFDSWFDLQRADYGVGYRACTFGEVFNLVHGACMHMHDKDKELRDRARDILRVFTPSKFVPGFFFKKQPYHVQSGEDSFLVGGSVIRGTFAFEWTGDAREINNSDFDYRRFVFIQDNPLVRDGHVLMDHPKELIKSFNREVRGVHFSEDSLTRAFSYGHNKNNRVDHDPRRMLNSSKIIFYTGDLNAPEKLAEIIGVSGRDVHFEGDYNSNETVAPAICVRSDGSLAFGANSLSYSSGIRSFGRQTHPLSTRW